MADANKNAKQIKDLVKHSSVYDPFSQDFNRQMFQTEIRKRSIQLDEPADRFIRFVFTCNNFYSDCSGNIFRAFDLLAFNHQDLIKFLFHLSNRSLLKVTESISKQMEDQTVFDLEKVDEIKIKSESGQSIRAKAATEMSVDALQELLKFVLEWIPSGDSKTLFIDHAVSEDQQKIYDYLMYVMSILINIRSSAFDVVHQEAGDLEFRDGAIKVVSEFETVLVLRHVNQIRDDNNRTQYELPLLALSAKQQTSGKQLDAIASDDGIIEFRVVESTNKLLLVSKFLPTLTLRHAHLAEEQLSFYGGATLAELGECLAMIDQAIGSLIPQLVRTGIVPSQLDERSLVAALTQASAKSEDIIRKFVDSLKSDQRTPYFWRAPLYPVSGKLMCSLLPLTSPNYSIYYEKWLMLSKVSKLTQQALFTKDFIDEFKSKHFPYDVNISLGDSQEMQDLVLIKGRDFLAIAITHPFEFPLEIREVANVFSELELVAKKLAERIQNLLQTTLLAEADKAKAVVGLVITNHPMFSGNSIDRICVTDTQLLFNYLKTGKFQRVRFNFNKPILDPSSDIGTLTYYNSEDEFNSNFLKFIVHPPPITQILRRFKMKEVPIVPPEVTPQILIDRPEHLGDEDLLEDQISIMSDTVRVDSVDEQTDHEKSSESIQFELESILSKLAFSSYEGSLVRVDLIDSLKEGRQFGVVHLAFYILKSLSKISSVALKKERYFKKVDYDAKEVQQLLQRITPKLQKIRLSEFTFQDEFTPSEAERIISFSIELISTFGRKFVIDDADVVTMLMILALVKGFKHKFDLDHEFYTGCTNIIDVLNNSNKYQKARDLGEEILMIAISEKKPYYGWDILFRCYSHQKSTFDASIYGGLLLTSVSAQHELPYSVVVDTLYNVMRYFRNFGYYEFAHNVYENLKSAKLDEYDDQKITITYFNTLLLGPIEKKGHLIPEIFRYLDQRLDKIRHFGYYGCMPWLALLYNLRRLRASGAIKFTNDIDKYVKTLESDLKPEDIQTIKERVIGSPIRNKEIFIRALSDALETRASNDFSFEVKNLEHYADNLLEDAIVSNDVDGVLLTGFVKNDQSFTYKNIKVKPLSLRELRTNEEDSEIKQRLKDYKRYVIDHVNLKPNTCLLWLFNIRRKVFQLTIDSFGNIATYELKEWDYFKVKKWTSVLPTFSFNEKEDRHYDLAAQESDYESIKKELAFAEVNVGKGTTEVLYCSNLDLAIFPFNLLMMDKDFIASRIPICNVISIERLIENSQDEVLNTNFTMSVWIPKEDQETIVSWGYEIITRTLNAMQYNFNLYTSTYPKTAISTDVNVFLAHGQSDGMGFKGVYTNPEKFYPIFHQKSVFGSGKVAILFICHSGSSKEQVYSNNVVNLAGELLKVGYEAVVAPFWPLDVTITGIWLREFLSVFSKGFSVSEAVHLANNKLIEYDTETGYQFYAPQGRLAMHLYGNPNIEVQEQSTTKDSSV